MRARNLLRYLGAILALAALFTGCAAHRRVQKTPYQTALEAYSAAGTPQELEKTLAVISAALDRDPSDAQLRLLRASTLLRKLRTARPSRPAWERGDAALLLEDLRRIIAQLSQSSSGLGWIGARACIVAADLALLRAQTESPDPPPPAESPQPGPDPLGTQLQARALRQMARDFYARAFQIADASLKSSPTAAAPALATQRDHALEGFLTAQAHIAASEDLLELSTGPPSELMQAREAALKGQLPEGSFAFAAPVSLEPLVHDRDWRLLRAARPRTQREWLRSRELAFRGQVAASFLEDPGRARLYTTDLLEDLVTTLAAGRLRWRLITPLSPDQLRLRLERHPWYLQYTAPVLDFAIYLADRKVLDVSALEHRPLAANQRPGPVFVPPEGVTLVLHPGEAPEPPPAVLPGAHEVHLYLEAGTRFEFLGQKGARLRVVDGFGRTAASLLLP